jgi:hypothetical protein
MDKQKAVAGFLETISLLDAQNGVKRETALHEGRQDPSVVLAALEHGHPCLLKPILIGEAQRAFLQLVCEAMGMPKFLRAELRTVHPKVFASFVKEYLYPEDPPESLISDDDLRYMVERFGTDDYTVKGRVLKIIANRKDQRAAMGETCKLKPN